MRRSVLLMWLGEFTWIGSLIALPLLKLHIPGNLWVFPLITLPLLVIVNMRIPYVRYIIIALSIGYLAYALLVIKLWMYFLAGLILLVLFIMVFQWLMGREWRSNPLYWIIIIALIAIIITVGGAIIGPILIIIAQTMKH